MSDNNHAIDNGNAWYAEIAEWAERRTKDDWEDTDERPEPLSVEVRSDWSQPGRKLGTAGGEYCILLTTGGPALRLIGNLDNYSEPETAKLQWQDWGTPWTDMQFDSEPLLVYAREFYFAS